MAQVNGFFGYVKEKDLKSGLMFLGFLWGAQVVFFGLAMVPLHFFDLHHGPFFPLGYLGKYPPIVLIVSIIWFTFCYFTYVSRIHKQVGYRYLYKNENRQLFTIVETLALTAGILTPKIGMINSPARNAFACGLNAKDAVIVVTSGLVDALTFDELEAVIAHEITHIANGDISLMAAANAMQAGLEVFAFRWMKTRSPQEARKAQARGGDFRSMRESFIELARVGVRIGNVSRLVISSSREFIADAEAVRLTHKPAALISALQRIENLSTIDGLREEHGAMMIDGATIGKHASHPTISERIAALRILAGEMLIDTMSFQDARPDIAFGKIQPFKPKVTLWKRFNRWLDDFDAKAAGKLSPSASLYDRVDPEQAVALASQPWVGKWLIGMGMGVVMLLGNPFQFLGFPGGEVATKQPDGTYLRNDVVMSASEYKKMKRDLRTRSNFEDGYSPSRLVSPPSAPEQVTPAIEGGLGLRGRSFGDEGATQ